MFLKDLLSNQIFFSKLSGFIGNFESVGIPGLVPGRNTENRETDWSKSTLNDVEHERPIYHATRYVDDIFSKFIMYTQCADKGVERTSNEFSSKGR